MTYYGSEAIVLGLCMFFGLFSWMFAILTMNERNSRIRKASVVTGIASLSIFALTLLNELFEVV